MGTISPTWPSDGDTIDASDVSTPGNIIVNAINGNLDSNNISAGGITPANLTSGTGTSWAWQSYVPTWVNLTVGNGTVTAAYTQIGKTVHFKISVVFGSTTSIAGSATASLPITSAAVVGLGQNFMGKFRDDSTAISYLAHANHSSTTVITVKWGSLSGSILTDANISSTSPFTWATSDQMHFWGTYEAA